jgi:hypothetical protein
LLDTAISQNFLQVGEKGSFLISGVQQMVRFFSQGLFQIIPVNFYDGRVLMGSPDGQGFILFVQGFTPQMP